ncbi:MAG TPA: hypothetical protein V6D17_21560 [Candidatus Obscuribacterales bacterium]
MMTNDWSEINADVCDLQYLPAELKRMLRVQMKEFINFIEDREYEQMYENSLRNLPRQAAGTFDVGTMLPPRAA